MASVERRSRNHVPEATEYQPNRMNAANRLTVWSGVGYRTESPKTLLFAAPPLLSTNLLQLGFNEFAPISCFRAWHLSFTTDTKLELNHGFPFQ